jgi:hypothetical protein
MISTWPAAVNVPDRIEHAALRTLPLVIPATASRVVISFTPRLA